MTSAMKTLGKICKLHTLYCTSIYEFLPFQAGAHNNKEFEECLNSAHKWLKNTQVSKNPENYQKYYRQMNKVSTVKCFIKAVVTGFGLTKQPKLFACF